MYCTNCGKQGSDRANFCQSCGQKFNAVMVATPTAPVSSPIVAPLPGSTPPPFQDTKKVSTAPSTERLLGTKWLTYWTYIHLPFTGVIGIGFGLLIASQIMWLGIVVVAICAPYLATSIGLHKKRAWGWRLNWLTIALNSVNGLAPNSYETIGDQITPRVAGEFTLRLIFVSLVWILPNFIYWRKRRHLFS